VVVAGASECVCAECPKCRKPVEDAWKFCKWCGTKLPPPSPQNEPEPHAKTNPRDSAAMIYIPAGEFVMGSSGGQYDERPQRKVYLDAYWIYKYEVTVAQYRRFCQTTGRSMPDAPRWGYKDDHPIVNVTWNEAKAYADWASVALPTEAQWEKAARGTDGRKYPWGNQWDASKCANSVGGAAGSLGGTKLVGSYAEGVSPCGPHDMAGNVWEWCADWYAYSYYAHAPSRNPPGPSSGEYRLLRGGSWYNCDSTYLRCAFRSTYLPYDSSHHVGFRCVVSRPDSG